MVWAGIPNREDWTGDSVSTMKRDNITEPCIVCRKERATVADGKYFLNLNISNFKLDAAPSRPFIYSYN